MKQSGGELQETLTEFDDRAVVDYLVKSPELFTRNMRAMEAICVPRPVHGIVSLIERYTTHARDHIHVPEENMTLLVEQTITNEGLFYRLPYLQRNLTIASSLDDILMYFHRWARDFGLADVSLRLFLDRWRSGTPSNHTRLVLSHQFFEPLCVQRLGQEQHYLGSPNGSESLVMLPEARTVGSVAISMLGSDAGLGVVLFTSHDASYYQQEQGA